MDSSKEGIASEKVLNILLRATLSKISLVRHTRLRVWRVIAIIVGVSYLQGERGSCFQVNSACGGMPVRSVLNPLTPLIKPMIADMIAGMITQLISHILSKMDKPIVF